MFSIPSGYRFPGFRRRHAEGDLGQPRGVAEGLAGESTEGEKPITVRPGSLLAPADLAAARPVPKRPVAGS